MTPLHFAARDGYADVVKLLLDADANPNDKDSWTPLHSAGINREARVEQMLLAAGGDPDIGREARLAYDQWLAEQAEKLKQDIERRQDIERQFPVEQ